MSPPLIPRKTGIQWVAALAGTSEDVWGSLKFLSGQNWRAHHAVLRSRTHPDHASGPRRGDDQYSRGAGDAGNQGAHGRVHLEDGGGGPDRLRGAVGVGVGSNSDDSLDAELSFLPNPVTRINQKRVFSKNPRQSRRDPRRLALCLSRASRIATGPTRATLASRLTREARQVRCCPRNARCSIFRARFATSMPPPGVLCPSPRKRRAASASRARENLGGSIRRFHSNNLNAREARRRG